MFSHSHKIHFDVAPIQKYQLPTVKIKYAICVAYVPDQIYSSELKKFMIILYNNHIFKIQLYNMTKSTCF